MDTKALKDTIESLRAYRSSIYPAVNKFENTAAFDIATQATDDIYRAIQDLEKAIEHLEAGSKMEKGSFQAHAIRD